MTDEQTHADPEQENEQPLNPEVGDVVYARFRWPKGRGGKLPRLKLRPCLIIRSNEHQVRYVPLSSHADWKAKDCIEMNPDERPAAGLTDERRTWAKVNNFNDVEINENGGNFAIAGRIGKASPEFVERVQREHAFRQHEGTLDKGFHVKGDDISVYRETVLTPFDPEKEKTEARTDEVAQESAPATEESVEDRIKRRARDKVMAETQAAPTTRERTQPDKPQRDNHAR